MEDNLEIFNNDEKPLIIADIMKRAVECYVFIDQVGEKLSNICYNQIESLLDEFKFDEAKKHVNKFYKPSNIDDHVIFIERDIIMTKINRMKSKHIKQHKEQDMKLFEEREFNDGGPNDKVVVKGYHEARSEDELRDKLNIHHGFTRFREINKDFYMEERNRVLKLYRYKY